MSDNVNGTGNVAAYDLQPSGETVINETGRAGARHSRSVVLGPISASYSAIYFPHACGNFAIIRGMTTTAILTSKADHTSFSFGRTTIRFLTPRSLVRYTSVKKWGKKVYDE